MVWRRSRARACTIGRRRWKQSFAAGRRYLASHVAKVLLLVRGPELAASMSRYLIDRIAGLTNVLTQTKVTGLEGRDGVLEAIRWRQGSGEEVRRSIQHLFLFIGADPNTDWLSGSGVALDVRSSRECR